MINERRPYPESPVMNNSQSSPLADVFWRRKGPILFFFLCGLGAGYYYFTTQNEIFRATAVIEVAENRVDTGTNSAVEKIADAAPSIGFIKAEITSDEVMMAAVKIGQLTAFDKSPADLEGTVAMIRSRLELSPAVSGAENKERAMVLVSFVCEDPTLSSAVINSVVEAYRVYVNNRHRSTVGEVVGFFRDGRDTIVPKLEELEAEYSKFRATAPLEWNSSGDAINPFRDRVVQLEESLQKLGTEDRQLANKIGLVQKAIQTQPDMVSALREVNYLLDGAFDLETIVKNSVTTSAVVQEMRTGGSENSLESRYLALQVRFEAVSSTFGVNHPEVLAVKKEMQIVRQAIDSLRKNEAEKRVADDQPIATVSLAEKREEVAQKYLTDQLTGMIGKRALLLDEIESLKTDLETARQRAHSLVAFENDNSAFQRQIERYQGMLDSLDGQLEKADLPTINSGLSVRVLRPAGSGQLVGPQMGRDLAMGGIIGLLVGSLLGFVIEWSERTFRSPDELDASLGVAILTHLPLVMMQKSRKKKGKDKEESFKADASVRVLYDPHSPFVEALRGVRNQLFTSFNRKSDYQVVQVTSVIPGDGKSTVTANLAASIASVHRRVLVIDADLRKPVQRKLFGIEQELGLSDVLNGVCGFDEAVVESEIAGLYVLPAGKLPSNPAEALALPEFGYLLDDLRLQFDIIFIDTPPMLAVSDPSVVAGHADGVLFVMRITRNVKPTAKRAMHILRSLNVNIIGVVVNAIGESSYSINYANAWSETYGGQPGGEYSFGYYGYGSEKYLDATKRQTMVVTGTGARPRARTRAINGRESAEVASTDNAVSITKE